MFSNPKLIINADDYGADPGRSLGILHAMREGRVTDTSLLANSPGFDSAVADLKLLKVDSCDVGLHLNFSEGRPLSPHLRTLTNPHGFFLGKQTIISKFLVPVTVTETIDIEKEMRAQIERIMAAGLNITHLDGHNHIHLFPAVLPIAIALTKEYRIPWFRLSYDNGGTTHPSQLPQLAREAALFCDLAQKARPTVLQQGINVTDHFCGLHLIDQFTPDTFKALLGRLNNGVTELMVHPGLICSEEVSHFSGFASAYRQQELAALFLPEWHNLLARYNITLTSFSGLNKEMGI